MRDRLGELAATLDKEVFQRIEFTTRAVFLVGAARSTPSALRDQLREELAAKPRTQRFDVYYAEDLFEELLHGGEEGADLLQLENMLAESVHAIVILLESPGAIAELGAFANHRELRDRLVVVVDKKYRHARSFIMLGPIKYLKGRKKSEIVFHDLKRPDLDKLGGEVRSAVRRVARDAPSETSVRNLVAGQHYLRAAIRVLAPVPKTTLQSLIQRVIAGTAPEANRYVGTSLSILLRDREIALGSDGYSLTAAGRERLKRMFELEKQGRDIVRALDRARVDVLTWTLRRPRKLTA